MTDLRMTGNQYASLICRYVCTNFGDRGISVYTQIVLGKSIIAPLVTGAVRVLILFVSFDLDRPERGFIRVPATPLDELRASMDAGPVADAP